jgi:hypothetical protein
MASPGGRIRAKTELPVTIPDEPPASVILPVRKRV